MRASRAHSKGDSLREQEQWADAIVQYQDAIRLNPQFSWSHHSLGDCYKKLGDWTSAVAAYRRAIELKGDFVWSHYSLGEALENLGQWRAAAESYGKAGAIAPENPQIPPRLVRVLQALLKQEPRNIEHYKAIAEQFIAQDKTVEAISAYQLALQIRPDDSGVAVALSNLLKTVDPEQSDSLWSQALADVLTDKDIRDPQDLKNPQTVFALLKHTHLFDAVYYRTQHSALAELSDQALLHHYIATGSDAGYQPNPLFDDSFYRRQCPDVARQGLNPLAHYHCFGYKIENNPHPFFSTQFYCETHDDVAAAAVDPLEHYLAYGARRGRAAFSDQQFPDLLSQTTPNDADYLISLTGPVVRSAAKTIGVYCSSLGNYFITEIADFIAAALNQAGHRAIRLNEQDTPPENLDGHWVVAPHEFFYLGGGERWGYDQKWLSQVVMMNVEQPQTTWFSKAFHFLRHSKIIFDINVKSAAIMRSLGLPAYWLPLGYLEDYAPFAVGESLPDLRALRSLAATVRDCLPTIEAPLNERPLDIHFIGTLNKRRELFFAESARWLSEYRCFLHMPPMGVPLLKGEDQALDTAAAIGISRRSKILLNVHRDELPYFEWHRMIFHGLWQNTLVVTEPCHDIPGLVAGEHFVACELGEMAQKVEWLLRSPAGQAEAERIRKAGHLAFKRWFNASDLLAKAVALAQMALGKREGVSV